MNKRLIQKLRTIAGLLPAGSAKVRILNVLGYRVSAEAHIGINLLVGVEHLRMEPGARIGSFNVFRSLKRVDVERSGRVGSWNWISASPEFASLNQEMSATFSVKDHGAATSRHYIDCSGGVLIGSFSILAGQRSTILSHGIDFEHSEQRIRQVEIGEYCFISTGCTLVSGSLVKDKTVIAAGAVVNGSVGSDESPTLWGGVPARFIKQLSGEYFVRSQGFVEVRSLVEPVLERKDR